MSPVAGAVILLAAGRSTRMGPGVDKIWSRVRGDPLLQESLTTLAACPSTDFLALVTRPRDRRLAEEALAGFPKPWRWIAGGVERQDSVYNGLRALPASLGLVAVHDAARPFASCDLFCRVLAAAGERGAVLAAWPATDTVKEVAEDGQVAATPDRARLWLAQTPQGFQRDLLERAHRAARAEGVYGTDDTSLVERLGVPVHVVRGERWNLKITHPEDLTWARAWRGRMESGRTFPEQRVGYGYDIHPFASGRPLWLGGVKIADAGGLRGHSDADVLLHALCDALLGAVALGDIGQHFPNSDPSYRGMASRRLLEQTWSMVRERGWHLSNADLMVLAERPQVAPFVPAMRRTIAETLACDPSRVSIKATTHEGLGAIGAGEGIAAHAVVHLWRPEEGFQENS